MGLSPERERKIQMMKRMIAARSDNALQTDHALAYAKLDTLDHGTPEWNAVRLTCALLTDEIENRGLHA